MDTQTIAADKCYHCGTEIGSNDFRIEEKKFCCIGCESVYLVLSSTDMCNYYAYNDNPGQKQIVSFKHLEYLDEPGIASKLIDYTDDTLTSVTFYIPAIHCSSCIWLLEHLHKLNPGVVYSRIDFLKKQASITFRNQEISLKKLVELMTSIGYEPLISLQDVIKEKQNSVNHTLIKKIAVAGFCMGNVMLLSFPEYLGLASFEQQFRSLFGWLNFAFSIPVTFYCGREFFTSAWASLRHKIVNLDTPLALIIAVLFLRSAFEIITSTGPGFTDTLTGLVFLLLCGRWVKQRTYYHLSFNRDYRSYFPVAVTLIRDGHEKPVAIEELSVGDRMLIRNNEIIPADAILMKGDALTDFSFVTGESAPLRKVLGEIIYAGGRQTGEAIELEVIKPVSQSYLTSLWNNDTFTKKNDERIKTFNDTIAKYFSVVTLAIALLAAGYWVNVADSGKAWSSFTAVLIVACPCVLALSTPFTMSAILAVFDKNLFYLKSTQTVEQLARIDTIVFDKTGTITSPGVPEFSFSGTLSAEEKQLAASLARNSMHPLSREIFRWSKAGNYYSVTDFHEIPGKGLSGRINQHLVRLGSRASLSSPGNLIDSGTVHLEINDKYRGYFKIKQAWRPGLKQLFSRLSADYDLHLLSGDNEGEKENLKTIFPHPSQMRFRQSPQQKLEYIRKLQSGGKTVIMLGDGLNDAGALKESNLGIAVTDDINNFSPACDAILSGSSFKLLPSFIKQAKDGVRTIRLSFIIAGSYNLIGLYFAVQGILSPLTAAVLMPLSTITILTYASISTRYSAFKNKLS